MKFSARTLTILKNFSTIHQALVFNPGTEIKVVSELNTILAKAEIDTEIPAPFAIFDMPRFLGAVSMFEDPDLSIKDGYMVISEGTERINYNFAEPSLIRSPPKTVLEIDADVTFRLPIATLNRVFKGAAITGASNICVTGDGDNCYIEALTTSNGSRSNVNTGATYRVEVGPTDKNFNFIFLVENIKMLPEDYDVTISKAGIAHFKGRDIEYWIAVEADSTFGK